MAGALPTASTLIETIVISCFLFAVAGVLEEMVHATAARPWAVRQDIRLTGVTTEIPDSCSRKVDIWISLAPFFVGLVALALLYLGIGIPPLTPQTQLAIAAWGYFMLPSLTDLQQAAGVSHGQREGLSKRARRGVSLYCLGWLCMVGGDEVGVLLLGSPAQMGLIPKQPFVAPAVTAQTVASAVFWIGVMVTLGSVVILIHEAKLQSHKGSSETAASTPHGYILYTRARKLICDDGDD